MPRRGTKTQQNRPKVVVAETLADRPAQWLANSAQLAWLETPEPSDQRAAELADAQGLIVRTYTQVNDSLLDEAPQLKVVARAGVGLDNIDVPACRRRGVEVVYTPDANTQAVVEYVLALILDALRPRVAMEQQCSPEHFHELRKIEIGQQLDHLTLGIVGFGRIGRSLGRVAHALGMKLLVCDLLPVAQLRNSVEYPFEFVDHASLYSESDIVSIHVDGRPGNRHLVGVGALSQMRSDVLLINAARGMLVDAHALAAWAKANPGVRAILDVHEPEPPPPDYPLWELPNVRLLPHLAARTEQALENMSWVVTDVKAVLDGKPPRNPAP